MLARKEKDKVIREEYQDVQVNWSRGNEKTLIANFASESTNSKFGETSINAKL